MDVLFYIFKLLDTKDLVLASRTCKMWRKAFNKYKSQYDFVMTNWFNIIQNKHLNNLEGVHTINLSNCYQITDQGLEYLKGVHTINLTDCNQITDQGLKYLKGVININMYNCYLITDQGLEYLKGAKILR